MASRAAVADATAASTEAARRATSAATPSLLAFRCSADATEARLAFPSSFSSASSTRASSRSSRDSAPGFAPPRMVCSTAARRSENSRCIFSRARSESLSFRRRSSISPRLTFSWFSSLLKLDRALKSPSALRSASRADEEEEEGM